MKVKSFLKISISIFLIITVRALAKGYFSAVTSLIIALFGLGVCKKNFSIRKEVIDNSRFEKYKFFWRIIKSLGEANEKNYLTKIYLHASLYVFIIASLSSIGFLINNELFRLFLELIITCYGLFFSLISFTYLMKPIYGSITFFKAVLLILIGVIFTIVMGYADSDVVTPVIELLIVAFSTRGLSFIYNKKVEVKDLTEDTKFNLDKIELYLFIALVSVVSGFRLANSVPEKILQMISKDYLVFSLGFAKLMLSMGIFFLIVISLNLIKFRNSFGVKEKLQTLFIDKEKGRQ